MRRVRASIIGVILPNFMKAMIRMQKCTGIVRRGLLVLLLLSVLCIPARAASVSEESPAVEESDVLPAPDAPVAYEIVGDTVSPLSASSPQNDFMTSASQIFGGVIKNVDRQELLKGNFEGVNYVAWRDDYHYNLAYSPDLVINDSGTVFSSPSVTLVSWYSYSGDRAYTVGTDSNFSLNAHSRVVCSNLGVYPCLDDGRGAYGFVQTGFFVLAGACCLVGLLFKLFSR